MKQPQVLYISYDGMGEPLGETQVLGYLEPLATEFRPSLVSFEKPGADINALGTKIRRGGIDWIPLPYHDSPPVLSTLRDIVRGVIAAVRAQHRSRADIVHVRSYVAGCIALLARARPLLLDIRGLWADERVEGGLWRRGGLIDRLVRMVERRLLRRAAAVVTLTHASVPALRTMLDGAATPIQVIPTCTDVSRFADTAPNEAGPRAVWVGSIGPWYRFDMAVAFADLMGLPMHVLTRQTDEGTRLVGSRGAVKTVAPRAIADELCEGDVGLCFYHDGLSAVARAPTRAAEYLAAGMPIAVTPRLGDLPELVTREGVGVIVGAEGGPGLEECAQALLEMRADPAVRARCREIAGERFDRQLGVDAYRKLYMEILDATGEPAR